MLRQTLVYYICTYHNKHHCLWLKSLWAFAVHPKKSLERFLTPILFLFLLCLTTPGLANPWRELAAGIEYTDLGATLFAPWAHVHVFRIDLKNNQLNLVMASDLSQPHASADEFAHHSKALITVNGGFFDHNYRPLGLRISNHNQHNQLKRISWWGVFYIKNQKPHISSHHQFKSNQHIDFALQSGPRLLIDGLIPSLKAGRAERSALGIAPDGRVILLVTDNAPMTTTALAKLMRFPPLNCKEALNLDGGSSSQLYAHINSFNINVHGFSNVSDAIIVKPR